MTSERLCLFSCLLLFLFRVSHVSQLESGIFQVKPLQVRNSTFEIFVASFAFRISRQLIRFAEPGVTDLFVYWISLEMNYSL